METKTPWAAEGLTLSSREEKLAHYLLSRGKTDQLERLLAKARAGVSTGLTSPAAGGHAHATNASRPSRARPLAPHNRPPPRPGKGPQRRPPSVAYAARRGPEQAPVKAPVTATARAPDPPSLPPPPPRKETPSPPDEASPGETPSPANVTLRRRGRAGPVRSVPPTPQGATPPQAPPTLVREATPPQASPVAATATPPPLREATPPQASLSAPTPVRNATPPAAPTPVVAAPATVSPIYRDTALIAADDEACERALTNWLRAPGLAADASAAEWRDAWRVAAAAADVALQKAVQVDQERMRVLNDYETFRAGATNLATLAARNAHAELETAKTRISALKVSLARYQAAYPPPPVGDEAASDDAHDGSALPASEAAPRAQTDVLAPTPRPGRARLSVATPAPRPRRYATRSSTRRGRAD
ncbi:unnamed protein product [Pelagomonas calceolata]|uniref:Uncharacterized protein n=1 Tax=Pelagomonas calceolata TaxID=35677 RepID=A0A8J2SUB0_9STRA|nr:unnamed protein product [Pelagomonas calceolata]